MNRYAVLALGLGLLLLLGCGEDASKKGANSGKDMPVAATSAATQK